MGKHKNRRPKQLSDELQVPDLKSVDDGPPDLVEAIDGHNTDGWTDDEIRAYNELVLERQRLEKQRCELEEKCAKSQIQRALLHENVANIDNLFKPQDSMSGAFVFGGTSNCCVDLDAPDECDHEICKRAKTQGVSVVELNTIKYYSGRLHSAQSDRMRGALRKQRDLELVRIKKDEDESQAQVSKKSSKRSRNGRKDQSRIGTRALQGKEMSAIARDTENIVNKIIGQLDDLRSDLQTGRITAEEAQGKLNLLDSKLPLVKDAAVHKSIEKSGDSADQDVTSPFNSFQLHLRDRLLGAPGDAFSQAFSIMDHFLSATKPTDLHNAISQLKDVLQLTGPMCDELQSSLGALEGIFDHPDKLSFTGPDGKQECSSIIDLMEKLKETLKRTGQLPDGANESLTKVFQECLDIEAEAIEQLNEKCGDDAVASNDLPALLAQIKGRYVAKSPIPPLTSNKLELEVASVLNVYDATQLLSKAKSGASAMELEASITSLVISRTQKQTGKYVEKLENLSVACRSLIDNDNLSVLSDAIANVLNKMRKWVSRSDAKARDQPKAQASTESKTHQSLKLSPANISVEMAFDTQAQLLPPSASSRLDLSDDRLLGADASTRGGVVASVERLGLWRTFRFYSDKTSFGVNSAMAKKLDGFKADTRALIAGTMTTVEDTIYHLYKLGLCPGLVAVLISYALCEIAQQPDHDFQAYMKQFSTCVERLPPPISLEWSNTFQRLTLAITQLYVAVYVEAMATFPTVPSTGFAISTVEAVTKYILLGQTELLSQENLKVIANFFKTCFGNDDLAFPQSLEDAFSHYEHFCTNDRFRCPTAETCSKHMNFTHIPFRRRLQQTESISTSPTAADKTLDKDGFDSDFDQTTLPPSKGIDKVAAIDSQPSRRIVPVKTIVYYPPDHPNRQRQPSPGIPKANRRYAESMAKAMATYESTARKAFTSLTLYDDQKDAHPGPCREAFLVALARILDATERDCGHKFKDMEAVEVESVATAPRPAEGVGSTVLDEWTRESVSDIHDYFKQIRISKSASSYIELTAHAIHLRAISGCYPDPIEAVNVFTAKVASAGKIPDALRVALLDMEILLRASLEDPVEQSAYRTKRLKYLLNTVGALEPTVSSLGQMASQYPSAFREYYEIVLDKFENLTIPKVKLLEKSLSTIVKLGSAKEPNETSLLLAEFAKQAKTDWDRRLQDIIDSKPTIKENVYLSHVEDEASQVESRSLVQLDNESATIAKSPARRPIIEEQSVEASVVPSHAPILSLESSSASKSFADIGLSGMPPTLTSSEIEVATYKNLTFDEKKTGLGAHASTADADLVSSQHDNVQEPPKPEPQVPSSSKNKVSNSEDDTDTDDIDTSESVPAEVRVAGMTKWIRALQRNCVDLSQTSTDVNNLNSQYGDVFHSLTDKIKTQVSSYYDFVRQIAQWNNVDLNKISRELDQQDIVS